MNRYRNLDIDLLNHQRGGEGETLRARVAASPVGEQRDTDAPQLAFPVGMAERIRKLERRELQFDELIVLGEELASLLLPPAVRDFYRRSLDKLRADEGLRIRIRCHDPATAVLPWEYAYVQRADVPPGRKGPEGFLALDRKLSLVRYEIMGEPPVAIRPLEHQDIRTIALLAEVTDPNFAQLDLDREELNLRQALEGFGGIDARFLRPGTSNQLQEMLGRDAQVFHFSGHGELQEQMGEEFGTFEGQGRLIFAGDNGRADPVEVGALGLQLRGRGIRLVVLNACEAAKRDPVTAWAGIAPALVRQGIPAVVGMQYTIRDSGAIAFSRRFYRALAAGDSIDSAVSEGRLGILARSGGEDRDWGVPVLYMRSAASVLFPPPLVPLRRNLAMALATCVLLSTWFYLHIFPLISAGANRLIGQMGLGAGALAGLLALWKMLGTFLAATLKSEKGSLIERWLRHRVAKRVLNALFVVAVILFSITSSIYLHDDGPPGATVELSVLTQENLPFAKLYQLRTSPAEARLAGGPIFLFPPPRELHMRLDQPLGWSLADSTPVRPRPWKSVNLRVSSDIKKVELRALRLAPDGILMQYLPARDQRAERTYELHVGVGDKTYKIDDFRRGVVLLGGPKALLLELINKESEGDRKRAMRECLGGAAETVMQNIWDANREVLETDFINPGDTVTIEVVDLGLPELSFTISIPAGTLSAGSINNKCLRGKSS